MTSNFELTTETKVQFGLTFTRIRASRDIPARNVKKGDLGGWVSGNAWVSGDAWVDCSAAILWITFTAFYTITLTRKHVFVGCKSWSRKEAKKLTLKQAVEAGCPKPYFKPLKSALLAGMQLVKERP